MDRVLFIIHSQNPIYGASRSVSALIRNLDADIDIIFPIRLKKYGRITPEQITQYFGDRVRKVWYLPQPARYSIIDASFPFSAHIKSAIKENLFWILRWKYNRIYKKGNYSFIHLNSIILYPMLEKGHPMFLHVREVLKKEPCWLDRKVFDCLEKAHGVIYIDASTQKHCPNINVPQMVLVNPFDQMTVGPIDFGRTLQTLGVPEGKTVYSIIGVIQPWKGVDLAVKAFQKAKLENAVLLIVGDDKTPSSYLTMTKQLAQNAPNILFLGELENTDQVYRITDYVLRCDNVVGLGRTVFEGLYSGCGVIVQNQGKPYPDFDDLPESMRDRVFYYQLQDVDSLAAALQKTHKTKMGHREYLSNVPAYVEKFSAFVKENR